MSSPTHPKIYHITHYTNLAGIVADGCLWSDAEILKRGGPKAEIGIAEIKRRRLEELNVDCRPGTKVGDYVPFYFCPRSVMLYFLHRGNHPGLNYREGQRPIVHLAANLREVVAWAESQQQWWAFTDRNAGSRYFQAYRDLAHLDQLDWDGIRDLDFRDNAVKNAKQAEFLMFGAFPWSLVRRIGVIDEEYAARVGEIVSVGSHRPDVVVHSGWYYE